MYKGNTDIQKSGKLDWITIIMYFALVTLGWISIYAASYDLENAVSMFDMSGRAGMQLVWIATSLIIILVLLLIDSGYFDTYAFLFYAIGIFLLLVTIVVARDINGSRSWLILGPVRLQPAEFMKFIIALALAKIFDLYNFQLMHRRNLLLVIATILLPVVLVILQSETGTALVYMSFVLVLYREGLPGGILMVGVAMVLYFVLGLKFSDVEMGLLSKGEWMTVTLVVIFVIGFVRNYVKRQRVLFILIGILALPYMIGGVMSLFKLSVNWGLIALVSFAFTVFYLIYLSIYYRKRIYFYILAFAFGSFGFIESVDYVFTDVMQPHQQKRIKVTLGMEEDRQGAGYHVGQSKIAIGSGGIMGKGFLNGTQTKLKYVPEQDTDFIFCTIGEEWGFIGSSVVLIFYLIFILRLIVLAEKQTTVFGRVYGYGVVSVFLFHLMINIGMVIGIMPVIGIPLPFFSYGGSSLWGFTILLFIFLRIDRNRKRM